MLNPSLRPATNAEVDTFAAEVLRGLTRPTKTLPCRYFYDARGSELFERITRLPEYYPTRTETAILNAHAEKIPAEVPDGGVLIEFGSGSSLKTELLLERLPRLGAYVPIHVSHSALAGASKRLATRGDRSDGLFVFGRPAYAARNERRRTSRRSRRRSLREDIAHCG
jgi:uncharacterized SAM-dependent methyltransferase